MRAQDRTQECGGRTALGSIEEGAAAIELARLQDGGSVPDSARALKTPPLPSPSRLADNIFAFRQMRSRL
jgi:hypothetical protein